VELVAAFDLGVKDRRGPTAFSKFADVDLRTTFFGAEVDADDDGIAPLSGIGDGCAVSDLLDLLLIWRVKVTSEGAASSTTGDDCAIHGASGAPAEEDDAWLGVVCLAIGGALLPVPVLEHATADSLSSFGICAPDALAEDDALPPLFATGTFKSGGGFVSVEVLVRRNGVDDDASADGIGAATLIDAEAALCNLRRSGISKHPGPAVIAEATLDTGEPEASDSR
jgi:hypothetical protein